jgi:glycosyltransferase involved in cell wall biosynthesis|tara:strand:- start:300 stop:1424 length:1125 start_codon:yes stop_codon:yes gene_type:complete
MSIKDKPSLCIVVADIDFFFSHRAALAKKLSEKFQIIVISDIKESNESKLLKYDFIKFVHLKSRISENKLKNFLSVIRYALRLVSLLKHYQVDNIFFITLESSMIGAIATKHLKNKKYFIISGANVLRENKLLRLITTKVFTYFKSLNNKFIFQNNEDKMLFEKILGVNNNFYLIKGNGIDLSKISYRPIGETENIKFLFAGNLFYSKGVSQYYDAAINIKNANLNADFFIAGEYLKNHPLSIKDSLYKNIVESKSMKYLGSWDQKTFLENLYNYDVFVLPSFGEGIPLAALEAMASGRALICSDVPGCNSCVIDNKNGYLCEQRSSQSLTQSMQKIIYNKNQILKMGEYSRKIVENGFELDLIYKKYLNVIKA